MLLSFILGVFLLMFLGTIVLDVYPELKPLAEEGKTWVVSAYNMSLVKYGLMPTLVMIFGLVFLFGGSRR